MGKNKIFNLLISLFFISNIFTQNKLLVLEELVAKNNIDCKNINLFVVQHIKDNSIEFIKHLKNSGFKHITVIGKPYSVNENAKIKMDSFAKVIIPTIQELENLEIIDKLMQKAIKGKNKFICLDLGGYFSKYFELKNISPKNCLGIIEDTMNGIWFNEKNYKPKVPLISVASSIIKDNVEHLFVAKAILRNTENILINNFQQSLSLKNILILGYGRIGQKIASLINKNQNIYIYDINPLKSLKAIIDGFKIFNKNDFNKINLIIGVTGQIVFGQELLNLKNKTILINGSTRQREYDFNIIKNQILKKNKNHKNYTKITLKNGKKIYLLADGYPVNFWNTESIPEFCLDGVFSTIFILAQELIKNKYNPGYYPSEKFFLEQEKIIANLWMQKYSK